MSQKRLYHILDLQTNCTSTDVEKAWEAKKTKFPPNSLQYKEAKLAYETLVDPLKHELYNSFGFTNCDGKYFDNPLNFSASLLEAAAVKEYQKLVEPKPSITKQSVKVTLEDFYHGRTIKAKVKSEVVCKSCILNNTQYVRCPNCPEYSRSASYPCMTCKGLGVVPRSVKSCSLCNGTKTITEEMSLSINLEPGMRDGQRIKRSSIFPSGATSEMLFILEQAEHDTFKRQGDDLYVIKTIGLNEAICGCSFVVTHLDGRKLLINVPSGTVLFPGCIKVVLGEGMPLLNQKEKSKGDLFVFFRLKFPSKLPKESLGEIEEILPPRPVFSMPSNPETEEYNFTEFDPTFKPVLGPRSREAYNIDDKHDLKETFDKRDKCSQQ